MRHIFRLYYIFQYYLIKNVTIFEKKNYLIYNVRFEFLYSSYIK